MLPLLGCWFCGVPHVFDAHFTLLGVVDGWFAFGLVSSIFGANWSTLLVISTELVVGALCSEPAIPEHMSLSATSRSSSTFVMTHLSFSSQLSLICDILFIWLQVRMHLAVQVVYAWVNKFSSNHMSASSVPRYFLQRSLKEKTDLSPTKCRSAFVITSLHMFGLIDSSCPARKKEFSEPISIWYSLSCTSI